MRSCLSSLPTNQSYIASARSARTRLPPQSSLSSSTRVKFLVQRSGPSSPKHARGMHESARSSQAEILRPRGGEGSSECAAISSGRGGNRVRYSSAAMCTSRLQAKPRVEPLVVRGVVPLQPAARLCGGGEGLEGQSGVAIPIPDTPPRPPQRTACSSCASRGTG